MAKLKLSKKSDEEIAAMFKSAFQNKVRSRDSVINVSSFDTSIEERNGEETVVRMKIYSYAGETTRDQFHDQKGKKVIDGGEEVVVEDDLGNEATFKFDESLMISSNEYDVFYKAK